MIMNTLQRSSSSFRRQGSSGRIWTDHIQFMEPKANGNGTSSIRRNINNEENVSQMERNKPGRLHDDEVSPHSHPLSSPPSSKTQNKVHRSFFSSIFGRCMSSPTIHDWSELFLATILILFSFLRSSSYVNMSIVNHSSSFFNELFFWLFSLQPIFFNDIFIFAIHTPILQTTFTPIAISLRSGFGSSPTVQQFVLHIYRMR